MHPVVKEITNELSLPGMCQKGDQFSEASDAKAGFKNIVTFLCRIRVSQVLNIL